MSQLSIIFLKRKTFKYQLSPVQFFKTLNYSRKKKDRLNSKQSQLTVLPMSWRILTVLRLFHWAAQLPTSAQSERENISEITSWLRAVSLYLSLGKYTCSGIVPALFNVCVCICINFLWNMWYDVFLLTCSLPPFCSCRLSHHSHFESESDFFCFVLFFCDSDLGN